MKILSLSIFVMLLTSACSTVEVNTSGNELFYVAIKPGSEDVVTIERSLDFYFWGLSPVVHELNLQDEAKGLGLYQPSYVSVEQRYTIKDVFFNLITLGLYALQLTK